jgi:hypothetical protein
MADWPNLILGAVIGFIASAATLWLQHHIQWGPQKSIEFRRTVYDHAVRALSRRGTGLPAWNNRAYARSSKALSQGVLFFFSCG